MMKNLTFMFLFSLMPVSLAAQSLTTLVNFNGSNGAQPKASLIQGTDGNFYGTTFEGGPGSAPGYGTIFKVTPGGVLTTLYSFCSLPNCADGELPGGALVQASDGNFYGVTQGFLANYGTVFRITPQGALTTIYTFCSAGIPFCTDGVHPLGSLLQASDGNLYGFTSVGGGGTIFRISLGGSLTTIHAFCQTTCGDGSAPEGLMQGQDGNFYGTTFEGGLSGDGTVFEVTPEGTFTTLYNFCSQVNCTDGQEPSAGLIQASDGNFYGTTYLGGANGEGDCANNGDCGDGTVFKLTPSGQLTTLHSFCSLAACADGLHSYAGLIQASDGNFYGVAVGGGANADGTIFRTDSSGSFTTLYSFCSQSGCPDGTNPWGGLIQGTDGSFYGTTTDSAEPGNTGSEGGTVFKLALASTSGVPSISSGGVITGSGFGAYTSIAPDTFIEIYGSSLATDTRGWAGTDFNGINAPTSLDGTSVSIGGLPAFVNFISPTQVNVLVPSNVPTGAQPLIMTTAAGASSTYTIKVNAVEPGLLAPYNFLLSGTQYVVAQFLDGTYALPTGAIAGLTSRPALPGDIIVIYGIGFGPTTPSIPAGQLVQGTASITANFSMSIGGAPATVLYAGLAPDFTGVYQFNVTVPSVPAGNAVPLTFNLGGVASTQTLNIPIGQ